MIEWERAAPDPPPQRHPKSLPRFLFPKPRTCPATQKVGSTFRHRIVRGPTRVSAWAGGAAGRCGWDPLPVRDLVGLGAWDGAGGCRGTRRWPSRQSNAGERVFQLPVTHCGGGGGGPEDGGVWAAKTVKRPPQQPAQPPIRQLLGAADVQMAHDATSSTAPAHRPLGSANAETTPARALAAAADRTQRPNATCEGKNG